MNIKKIGILQTTILSFIAIFGLILFFLSRGSFALSFAMSIPLISVILIRIIILYTNGIYVLKKWIKQENSFFSDAYFLFASFFILLVIGKIIDLFQYYVTLENESSLVQFLITKVRFLFMPINIFPISFVAFEILVFFISVQYEITSKKFKKNLRNSIIISITVVEIIVVLISPLNSLVFFYSIIAFLHFLMISIIFLFMYRAKKLSQVNPLLIGIGIILFLISSVIRSLLTNISIQNLSNAFVPMTLAEIIDMGVFIVIFLGFIIKPPYAKI